VCVLLGAVKKCDSYYSRTIVRHQECCGTVARAACERYGMKLTFASDVGKDIIQVADAEVNRKDQLRISLEAFMTALNISSI
jgi:hypothetical protein